MLEQGEPSQVNDIEYLFETALTLPHKNRESWLAKQCSDTPKIMQEVLDLLKSHESASAKHFLSIPASQHLHIDIPDFTAKTVGAYKIEHLLGKGGMGSVYRAYRNDGEFEKKVAIKFVESGHIDSELIKRERQILADLEIPNVVTLLDGGTTENGYPYIVMEYVEGISIDKYARKHQLTQAKIIQLLIELCDIVHKANNRGIIHCDLKPSNIMIRDDGVLMLFDFGISRVAYHSAPSYVEDNLCKAMTPEYSSPQRCKNQIPAITDDVFSLGIIMAVLLLKQQPVANKDVITKQTCASTKIFTDQFKDIELKAIFLKATSEEVEERYPSASALAHDLQLQSENKHISVLQHKIGYRLKKTIQNDWPKLLASTLLLLMAFAIPSMFYAQFKVKKNVEDVNEVISKMIDNINNEFEKYQTSPYLRKTLIEYALSQTKGYRNVRINTNQAKLYALMGTVSGHPYAISNRNTDESKHYYRQSMKLYEGLLDKRADKVKAYEDYTDVKRHLAVVVAYSGDMKKGFSMLKQVQETIHTVYEKYDVPISKRYYSGLFSMVEAFGRMHIKEYTKASKLLDYAEKFFSEADNKSSQLYIDRMAFFYELRGHLAHLQHAPSEAKSYYLKVIDDYGRFDDSWKIQRSLGRINQCLGCLLLRENKLSEAQQRFLNAKHIYEKLSQRYRRVSALEARLNNFNLNP